MAVWTVLMIITSRGGGSRKNVGMSKNNRNDSYGIAKNQNKINAVGGDFSSRVTRMA
jgi:hypothetical protein